MKIIPLTRGYVALVDDEDYEKLSAYKWFAHIGNHLKFSDPESAGKKLVYAARNRPTVNGRRGMLQMHREILGLGPKDPNVDHADTNGLNNQRYNLRKADQAQNNANASPRQGETSRYKGVSFDLETGKWRAVIYFRGARRFIGRFRDEVDAAQAYNLAAEELFGEFARFNVAGAS